MRYITFAILSSVCYSSYIIVNSFRLNILFAYCVLKILQTEDFLLQLRLVTILLAYKHEIPAEVYLERSRKAGMTNVSKSDMNL